MIISIAILMILLICNLIKKKSKALFVLTVVYLWALMTFTTGNADHGIYESRYTNPELWKNASELVFSLLITICRRIGLSYLQYKSILCAIILILISSTIWKLSKYPNIVLLLYFVCPFALNAAQLRWALASAFLIFGYRYLLNDSSERIGNKKRNITVNDIKYIICVILATLSHTAAIFGFLLLLAKKVTVKSSVIWTAIISFFALYIFTPSNINSLLSRIGAGARIGAYFSTEYQNSVYRHVGWSLILVLVISLLCIFACLYIKRKNKKLCDKSIQKDIDFLLKANILMLVCLAFIIRYTGEMYRPQEATMILDYIVLMNVVSSKKEVLSLKLKKIDFYTQLTVTLLVFCCFYLKIGLSVYQDIWEPLFTNNILFK